MDASYKIQRGIHVHLIQFFMYIYKIRTFLLTFSVQSVIIIKLIRDSPVDRV